MPYTTVVGLSVVPELVVRSEFPQTTVCDHTDGSSHTRSVFPQTTVLPQTERPDRHQFGRPEVKEQGGNWLYTYEYHGQSKQSFAVIVFSDGRTELGRIVEPSR